MNSDFAQGFFVAVIVTMAAVWVVRRSFGKRGRGVASACDSCAARDGNKPAACAACNVKGGSGRSGGCPGCG